MKKFLKLSVAAIALAFAVGSQAAPNYCNETSNTQAVQQLRAAGVETHVVDFSEFSGVKKASDIYETILLANCPNIGQNGKLNNNELVVITGAHKGFWYSANLEPQLSGHMSDMQQEIKGGSVEAAFQIASLAVARPSPAPAPVYQPAPQVAGPVYQPAPPQVVSRQVVVRPVVVHHGWGFFHYLGLVVFLIFLIAAIRWLLSARTVVVTETVYDDPIPAAPVYRSSGYTSTTTSSASRPQARTTTTTRVSSSYPSTFTVGGIPYPGAWYNGYWGYYGPGGVFSPWGYYDPYGSLVMGSAYYMEGLILGDLIADSLIMGADYGWGGYLGDTAYEIDTVDTYGGGGYQDQGYVDQGGNLDGQGSNYQDQGGDLDGQDDQGGDLDGAGQDQGGDLDGTDDQGGGFDDDGGQDDQGGGFDDSGSFDDGGDTGGDL